MNRGIHALQQTVRTVNHINHDPKMTLEGT